MVDSDRTFDGHWLGKKQGHVGLCAYFPERLMRRPLSTYRLQVTPTFDLHDVAGVADYVRHLGADWLYLSPLLTAQDGSEHGYDVIDHSTVDARRGGAEGLEAAAFAARRLGLGVLVDIVPNHAGVADAMSNPWWRDVLTHGQASRYAEAFDIDWEFGGGKVRLPVLGDEPEPKIWVDGDTLRYEDHQFPLAPETVGLDDIPAVLAAQHYELVNWRRADFDLNYRRFFAVNTLAGIRVEVPWVFDASHAEIIRWIGEGLVDGLRVDHPDGLADPGAYLDMLASATDRTFVLVEKILQLDEHLPSAWAADGTTGYDALAEIDRVFIDPNGQGVLDQIDAPAGDGAAAVPWYDLIHSTKREVADGILRSEIRRIARELPAQLEHSVEQTEDAIAELIACFPVYRSYLPLGSAHLLFAARRARAERPDLSRVIDQLIPWLLDPDQPAARRFQQTSGMVMAKGVEDRAFYRYTRLGGLTEVGGDPADFSIDVDAFHRRQQVRHASLPFSMTALTTHDTKRGEDVRARLHVLAEMPDEWVVLLGTLRTAAPMQDPSLEQLIWQAVVGAWPASRERLHAYAEKAAREAGTATTWTQPSAAFEHVMHTAVDAAFDDRRVADAISQFVDDVKVPGWTNSLSIKAVQLSAPGVPDVYQGSELWETSLVDPDNRRSVDFAARRRLLDEIDTGHLPPIDATGAAKLLVTTRVLRLRRDHPEWFTTYVPVEPFGPSRNHVLAFDRGQVTVIATRLPVGLERRGGWSTTGVVLPSRPVVDVITGRQFGGGRTDVAELLWRYPVAVLAPDEPT
jgi:(1->4)-alpha-D-glucan 1-alpha-D-glucosylmutase